MESSDDFTPTTAKLLKAAMVLVVIGLVFVSMFLVAGFQSWSVGVGMFLGMPVLMLGILLYVVAVIRDLKEHNVFRVSRKPKSD